MECQVAKTIAQSVMERLAPYCSRIEVAGSIRRKKDFVNDIDFVLIAKDPWNLRHELMGFGSIQMGGDKLTRVKYGSVQLDFYFATPETWATLLLIRTGPKERNIKLCTEAKRRGWHLSANGMGLFDESGRRIAGDTEQSIFEALNMPYLEPERR